MKKRMIMILAAACIVAVSGCGAAGVSQESKTTEATTDTQALAEIQQASNVTTTTKDGMELRNVLDNNPSSIILYGFDEKKYEISDERDVETIIETLKNVSYKEKDQQDYEEGFYLMDINYGNETTSLGVGNDCVSYGGVQFETGKGPLDEVVRIYAKYLN